MAVLDDIYKAMQIGRSIGDPIARGLEKADEQRQIEKDMALRKALLQIQNPGLQFAQETQAEGQPAALRALPVGEESDLVRNLGGGAFLNEGEQERDVLNKMANEIEMQRQLEKAKAEFGVRQTRPGQFIGFVGGKGLEYNPGSGLATIDLPEGVSGPVQPRTEQPPANIFVGTSPGGGIVSIPSHGPVIPQETPLPSGGTLLPKITEPFSEKSQEDIQSSLNLFSNLKALKEGISESGRVKGLVSKTQTFFGKNQKAIDFETANAQATLSAQSFIKGTPSNFDIQTFINTLPDLVLPEKVNISRIQNIEKIGKSLLKNRIAFEKARGKVVPEFIKEQIKQYGIDPDSIEAWDGKGDPLNRGEAKEIIDSLKKQENKDSGESSRSNEDVKEKLRNLIKGK